MWTAKPNYTKYLLVATTILVIILPYTIWRDAQIEKQNPGDLRNRIVGARLQMDGKLPYFFKWRSPADDRYYDVHNFDSNSVSNITASPFFHQLLYPIANLKQREISRIWLFFEYLIILFLAAGAYFFISKTNVQKALVIFTLITLLFTIGWVSHIYNGQYYLFIPFLAMLFYLLTINSKSIVFNIIAGIIAAVMLLTRPNLIFFLIPFLFTYKQYNFKNLSIIICTLFLVLGLYFLIPKNRNLWKQYSMALKETANIHQSLPTIKQANPVSPNYISYEGWDNLQIAKEELKNPIQPSKEHANMFVLVQSSLKYKMPLWLLTILPFVLSILLCIVFGYINVKKKAATIKINQVAIFGYCLYMLSDFLSPVHRFPYNFMQWAFPLFLMGSYCNIRHIKFYLPIIAGIILNIVEIKSLRSEHSIGEYLILISMLVFAIFSKSNQPTQSIIN